MSAAFHTHAGHASTREETARTQRFYQVMGIAMLLAVLAGFARTYFLKSLTGWPPAPAIVHWHAALFTGWILLFFAQATLVASGRPHWHRRLGVGAIGLAVAMIAVGLPMTVQAAREGFMGVFPLPAAMRANTNPIAFSVQGFFDVGLFASFLAAALWFRGRPDVHKRLMLLATISLLPAALVRIPLPGIPRLFITLSFGMAFAAAQPLHDRLTRGRIHPAGLWGGLAFLASLLLRVPAGRSDAWQSFMQWLLNF